MADFSGQILDFYTSDISAQDKKTRLTPPLPVPVAALSKA